MLVVPNYVLSLQVPGNGLQRDSLHNHPRGWGQAEQAAASSSPLWPFLNTGVMFAFFQPSQISPSHHSFSRMIDNTLSLTPPSIPACVMNWCMFSMPKWSLTQPFSTRGSNSLPAILPQGTGTWGACWQILPKNTTKDTYDCTHSSVAHKKSFIKVGIKPIQREEGFNWFIFYCSSRLVWLNTSCFVWLNSLMSSTLLNLNIWFCIVFSGSKKKC